MSSAEWIASGAAVLASLGGVACMFTRRSTRMAGVVLVAIGWLGLLASVAPAAVQDHAGIALVVLALVVAVGWWVAGALVGRERWLLAAGGLVLVLRVPLPTGDGTAMLLAPLYAVIALGTLVLLRGEVAQRRSSGPRRVLDDRGGATRLIDIGAATLPVIAALSLTWSIDRDLSTEVLAFFMVPFFLAFVLVRTWLGDGVSWRPAAVALVGMAVLAALVGCAQAALHEVWWNPKVIDANRFRPDFRTNSLFWDPNIYGRALVVGLLALVALLLTPRPTRPVVVGGSVLVALLATALWFTYSQSSWFALGAALLALALLTLPPRPRRWAAALTVVAVAAALPWAAGALEGSDSDSRRDVVRDGIALAADRPLLGWGIGAFEPAAQARALEQGRREEMLTASHTTPVTVFAEVGVLGTTAYLLLLGSAVIAALARWRRASTPAAAARARGEAADPGWPIAPVTWATAVVVALFAHSLLYAGFFEDATLWVALAVLASLPRVRP
ncbi:MAG: O-antigen polymerase [Thermoleophilia bacterium]|nr:O-antigen polymerase [Thermoleophilia bacterium]